VAEAHISQAWKESPDFWQAGAEHSIHKQNVIDIDRDQIKIWSALQSLTPKMEGMIDN
jgi:hypothetical protein